MHGALITFEGPDGSGKTTQLRRQAERLQALGQTVLITREPGGTTAGIEIRSLLMGHRTPPLVPVAELLLYAADRAQHVRETIEPALAEGAIVLCDRYTDATVTYQGYGRHLDLALIDDLNRIATGGRAPDLTLLFDLDVASAERRMQAREGALGAEAPTRFDLEKHDYRERVREGYLRIAEAEPHRVRIVDASGAIEDVAASASLIVDAFLANRRR